MEILKPDIAIADISLKGPDGIELIKHLKTRMPGLPVLVLSIHDESIYAPRALRAGARGYIMKQEATENVLVALRRVLSGEVYLSDRMANKVLQQFVGARRHKPSSFPSIGSATANWKSFDSSARVMEPAALPKSYTLSVKTVESYREHIKEKMTLGDASELVRYAIQWMEQEKSQ